MTETIEALRRELDCVSYPRTSTAVGGCSGSAYARPRSSLPRAENNRTGVDVRAAQGLPRPNAFEGEHWLALREEVDKVPELHSSG